jgi:hypothetical protein
MTAAIADLLKCVVYPGSLAERVTTLLFGLIFLVNRSLDEIGRQSPLLGAEAARRRIAQGWRYGIS